MKPDIAQLVKRLRKLNRLYKTVCLARGLLLPSERLANVPRLQREADQLCGEIMRTERAIINALLK